MPSRYRLDAELMHQAAVQAVTQVEPFFERM
jgi:hypothetical protein